MMSAVSSSQPLSRCLLEPFPLELEGKGPLPTLLGKGADINVIGGKSLLGFCSPEKYITLK